jgi:nucleotide exchange factor SIL1
VFAQQDFLVLDELPTEYTQSETEICHAQECYPLYFVPTNEFQIVKPGQRIPKGLHVSIDFVTKVKKAKLMEGNQSHNVPEINQEAVALKESEDLMAEKLNQKSPTIIPHESTARTSLTLEEVKTLDVLFQKMNTTATEDIDQVLEILSDAVHQIDIGAGLTSVLSRVEFLLYLIHGTEPEICAKSALVLGTAVSNNPIAQQNVARVEGVFEKLLKRFANVDNSLCKTRILFLLTSLTRSDRNILNQLLVHDALNFLLSEVHTDPMQLKMLKYLNDIFPFLEETDLNVGLWCSRLVELKSASPEIALEATELYLKLQTFPDCELKNDEL